MLGSTEVQVEELPQTPIPIGDPGGPAFDGSYRRTIRGSKQRWEVTTIPLEAADVAILLGLLAGSPTTNVSGTGIVGTIAVVPFLVSVTPVKTATYTSRVVFTMVEE